jgi:RHS repeat-associated protein
VTSSGATKNYTYDANGNLTNDGVHTYQYDGDNRVKSVDGGATEDNAYDYRNRRIKKVSGGVSTHYVWEGNGIIAEHNGSNGTVIVDYIYSESRLIATVSSGSTQYFLGDRLSERLMLDSNGNVLGRQAHLPFGEDFAESGAQEKHHFTSYERESDTSLDYASNRYYSSSTGRFLSADPYQASNDLTDPRSWNRYSYTRNVLTNRVDPLGLFDVGAFPLIPWPRLPDYSVNVSANTSSDAIAAALDPVSQRVKPKKLDGTGGGPGAQDTNEKKKKAAENLKLFYNCFDRANEAERVRGLEISDEYEAKFQEAFNIDSTDEVQAAMAAIMTALAAAGETEGLSLLAVGDIIQAAGLTIASNITARAIKVVWNFSRAYLANQEDFKRAIKTCNREYEERQQMIN